MAGSSNRQKVIFLKALEISSNEGRSAFLDQACGSDDALRRQIEAMLQAHGTPDSFLEKPAAVMGATMDAGTASPMAAILPDEQIGKPIGPYKLLEQIGEGGMGAVYLAEQKEPVRRTVALKIIKPGMDSAQVLARFEAERQALALMDHPNIAKVLDAGTTPEGRPYFVMELVKGRPITQHCNESRLTLRQRLELFIPVCQAIQHAHQKAIIHRDLKPSNILVALYDGKPVPKVIDFGVAKAMGEQLTEKTLHTGFGAVVGTLAYMSPEQAELNQLDVDTRSDIYSLGVVLYELLTGTTPIDRQRLKEGAILEVLRMIREEDPPRPSTRLSASNTLPAISQQRQAEPARLASLIRGDIDWIVMKALDKDRGRRYETANSLAADIERHLKDEPVEASPPSAAYRLRKFVQRNRGAVTAASLTLLALLAGIGGTTAGLFEARWQRDEAVQARFDEQKERERATEAEQTAKTHLADALDAKGRLVQALAKAEQSAKDEKDARNTAKENEKMARLETQKLETTQLAILLHQAKRAWDQNDLKEAERLLELGTPESRGTWEYRYLRHAFQRIALPLPGAKTEAGQTDVALSPDGQTLAVPGYEQKATLRSIRVWNAVNGELKHSFKIDGNPLGIAFSSDGKRMAACVYSNEKDARINIHVWDLVAGKQELVFQSPHEVVGRGGVVFGNEDRLLIPASSITTVAGGITAWDSTTGKPITLGPKEIKGKALSAWLSPSGKKLLTTAEAPNPLMPNDKHFFKLWDLATGKEIAAFDSTKSYRRGEQYQASFSADGSHVAVSHRYGTQVWETSSSLEKLNLTLGGKPALSSNGNLLAIGVGDAHLIKSHVTVWNVRTGTPRTVLDWPDLQIGALNFSPDNQRLTVAHWEGRDPTAIRVHVLRPEAKGGPSRTLSVRDPMTPLSSWEGVAAISPDETRIASGFRQNNEFVTVWDAVTGETICRFKTGASETHALTFSPEGKKVLCSTANGVKWWDATTGKEVPGFDVGIKASSRRCQALSRDGKQVATPVGSDVWILDAATGQKIAIFRQQPGRFIRCLAFSPDGKYVAIGTTADKVSICEIATLHVVHTLPGHSYYLAGVTFSPDGRHVGTSGHDSENQSSLKIWDAETGKLKWTLQGNRSHTYATCFDFSPDSKRVAWGYQELFQVPQRIQHHVKISDLETGAETLSIKADHDGAMLSIAFGGDGRRLISTDNNGDIKIWDAP